MKSLLDSVVVIHTLYCNRSRCKHLVARNRHQSSDGAMVTPIDVFGVINGAIYEPDARDSNLGSLPHFHRPGSSTIPSDLLQGDGGFSSSGLSPQLRCSSQRGKPEAGATGSCLSAVETIKGHRLLRRRNIQAMARSELGSGRMQQTGNRNLVAAIPTSSPFLQRVFGDTAAE